MALLCDYFSAPNDEAAAAIVDAVGGPVGAVGAAGEGVVAAPGIEPVVMMGSLEALLEGHGTGGGSAVPAARSQNVAVADGGERLVFRLSHRLEHLLADADDARLAAVAGAWSRTPEFFGRGDPAVLLTVLGGLADLARTARRSGAHLYCWMCV